MNSNFWKDKRVFLTGHTGFKGSWMAIWLGSLGAKVTGYALEPESKECIYSLAGLKSKMNSVIGDVGNLDLLSKTMIECNPDVVIHMAAQPLVRESYRTPLETYEINVMGTAKVLESVRKCKNVKAVVNVTTDKCYENKEWDWGYREIDPVGGYDPYSSSKACSEIITGAYRNSFFNPAKYSEHGTAVGSARAGNVIGGGDTAVDRLIPDCIRAFRRGDNVSIRSPNAIRPWQHVLEPLGGYLSLAEHLCTGGAQFAEGWNFGPSEDDARSVDWIVKKMCGLWGENARYSIDGGEHVHEAHYLRLDCSKARARLGWTPKWSLQTALEKIVEWYRDIQKSDVSEVCLKQIAQYENEK